MTLPHEMGPTWPVMTLKKRPRRAIKKELKRRHTEREKHLLNALGGQLHHGKSCTDAGEPCHFFYEAYFKVPARMMNWMCV